MPPLPQPTIRRPRSRRGTSITALSLAALTLTLAACASPADTAGETASEGTRGHGYVEGAAELPEPQLHLATADTDGTVRLLDLLSEQRSTVATLGPLSALSGAGRFVAAQSEPPGTVTVVDTGVWTVDHEDHQHYYRADARVVGTVEGQGAATIVEGSVITTVRFADSGETILLDTAALGTGEVDETGRIAAVSGSPGVAVPIGETIAATGAGGSLVLSGTDGEPLDAASSSVVAANAILGGCTAAAGAITTNVGVVIGCAEGALLAVVDRSASDADPAPSFEAIPYPQAVDETDRATSFHARPGRPTVAAVAGTTGAWLLDTRERSWSLLPTPSPLQLVAAVDDRDHHVVALATDGSVLVLDGTTGAVTGATAPIVTPADLQSGVQLEVDQNRAYLNSPTARTVSEIDYGDAARIARTFDFDTEPAFLAETGR
ncbi:MAG TPA: ABC transporter [Plantibacter sp.]|uniref:ABC transporter n=1 Tax=Plantibacter sp. TaxID=1871045 RepID=UPI002D0E2E6F|nr:ABC transporter [Plantibacter sp.]